MSDKWNGEDRRHHNKVIDHEDRRSNETDQESEKSPAISLKTIGVVLGIIVSLGSIVSGVITFSNSYVSKTQQIEDLNKLKTDLLKEQEDISNAGKRLFIMMYEDQLEDIEFKIQNGTATEFEKSKKSRIERRIEAIKQGNI